MDFVLYVRTVNVLKRICLVVFCLYPALLLLNGVTVDILCRNTKVVLDVCAVNMLKY